VDDENALWRSSEQFYHAQKFKIDSEPYRLIRECQTPQEALMIARKYHQCQVPFWHARLPSSRGIIETYKDEIMMMSLQYKFESSPFLTYKLLATGQKTIFECSKDDEGYWGFSQGSGQNKLGKMLMVYRDYSFKLFQGKEELNMEFCADSVSL
jgi:ribA/ribD-fused uncharacterized protein